MSTETKQRYSVPVMGWINVNARDANDAESLVSWFLDNSIEPVELNVHENNEVMLSVTKGGFTRLASENVGMSVVASFV